MKDDQKQAWQMTKKRLFVASFGISLYFIFLVVKDFGNWQKVAFEIAILLGILALLTGVCFLICCKIIKREKK